MENSHRANIKKIFLESLESISSTRIVPNYVRDLYVANKSVAIVALGKAAAAMLEGAFSVLGEQIETALLVTKKNHAMDKILLNPRIKTLFAGHPIPDENSFVAGNCVVEFVKNLSTECNLLFLISGGTSSLVESKIDAVTKDELKKIYQWLLSSELNIVDINCIRKKFSTIKGGGLLKYIQCTNVNALYVSDVENNEPRDIGSGLLHNDDCQYESDLPQWIQELLNRSNDADIKKSPKNISIHSTVIMTEQIFKKKICQLALLKSYRVNNMPEFISGNTYDEAVRLAAWLKQQQQGFYVWAAETVMTLPLKSGLGGRNQSFALMMAKQLHHVDNIIVLAAGTDGSDGNTVNAGAIVDGETISRGLQQGLAVDSFLESANAGVYLSVTADVLTTAYTGTNVMDVIIAIIWD